MPITTYFQVNMKLKRFTHPICNQHPIVIAGPCAAETEEQVFETARQLKEHGISIFRAGVWKPRTKPCTFEGIGIEALHWLARVKNELHMMVATEVATIEHIKYALQNGIDILWIGARTTANPFAVQQIADALRGVNVHVLVKNPINPDLELWIGALERLANAGVQCLGAIHRGFSTYGETICRNAPIWHIPIELRRRMPELPIFCDPSHMGGKRDLIAPLGQQALDMGFDGLFVESHYKPDEALSDSKQQITPEKLQHILSLLVCRDPKVSTDVIDRLREKIDDIDIQIIELLANRMGVCRDVGLYKKEHNIPILQAGRYSEILEQRGKQGSIFGLSSEFVQNIFKLIHEESVLQQTNIYNNT